MLVIAGVVLGFFWLFTAFPLFLSILAKALPANKRKESNTITDFACVITAWKDIDCAINLVSSLLKQDYDKFHIYLVADSCEFSDFTLKHERLTVLFPPKPLNSKIKSIHYGLERLVRKHSHFIVFDPDNLAHPQYLNEMNSLHQQGFDIVQGKRIAKNLDTKYACLDAFSEYYYNYTQRTVPFRLKSSATIAGSAMSIPLEMYMKFIKEEFDMESDKIIIAEDKMLQVYVVQKGYRIAFAENALVYDEKVSTGQQVKRQRTRWITSYFQYLLTGVELFFQSILTFSLNKILFAYTIIIPPMFIIGLAWMLLTIVSPFVSMWHFIAVQICFVAFILNIFIALIFGNAPSKVVNSLFYAPLFVINQIKALFSMNQTKTSFLTTEKTKNVSVEEVLNVKL
ncbi:MAG: glycosyltransferase [Opitutaceae bacterium]|nr:glycosyltransferase [Cytophagales bacterium]